MRSRYKWGLLAAVAVAACSSPAPKGDQAAGDKPMSATARATEITLTTVKWPELQTAIASHKGKVVVLDVWGEF